VGYAPTFFLLCGAIVFGYPWRNVGLADD